MIPLPLPRRIARRRHHAKTAQQTSRIAAFGRNWRQSVPNRSGWPFTGCPPPSI